MTALPSNYHQALTAKVWNSFCMSFISTAEIFFIDAIYQDKIFLYCKYIRQYSTQNSKLKTIWSIKMFNKEKENKFKWLYESEYHKKDLKDISVLINSFPIPLNFLKNGSNNNKQNNLQSLNNDETRFHMHQKLNSNVLLRDDVKSCELTMCTPAHVESTVDENVLTEEATSVNICGTDCWSTSLPNDFDFRCLPF